MIKLDARIGRFAAVLSAIIHRKSNLKRWKMNCVCWAATELPEVLCSLKKRSLKIERNEKEREEEELSESVLVRQVQEREGEKKFGSLVVKQVTTKAEKKKIDFTEPLHEISTNVCFIIRYPPKQRGP